MQILTTQAQLRKARHTAGVAWKCGDCGKVAELNATPGAGTGYGYFGSGARQRPICYACCSKRERARMIETGEATLYLTRASNGTATVQDWPGTLVFKGGYRKGRHNLARTRYDVWFIGPDGAQWHGVQYGESTQICHCKRTAAAVATWG